ncbi:Crp/Fnr family transcriptional regulator [Hydrogenivirga sp.]
MIKEEKLWYLKNLDILSGLSEEELKFIDENSVGLEIRGGEIIYSPEDEEDFIYFLKRGVVKLYRVEPEGREVVVALLGPGDIFGGISSYDRGSYGEFAQVMEDAFLCMVNRKLFFDRMSKNPTVMLKLNRFLGLITYELEMRLEDIVSKSVLSRVSSVLIKLLDKFGDREGRIGISLSHRDIATMVGATREATTLALNRLKNEGVIELARKRIRVLNRDLLEEFKNS